MVDAKKNLKYFMRSMEPEVVTAPGCPSITDDEGNILPLEIKVLSQEDINRINDAYRKRSMATDKKGNPLIAMGEVVWKTEKDSARASRHLIVEALQFPNLKDKELMEYYHCVDVTDMPLKVFPKADEYQHVSRMVMQALGLASAVNDDEELEAAKTRKHSRLRRLLGERALAETPPPHGGVLQNAARDTAALYSLGA